ncbi:hypothetical protein MRBLMA1_000519 [Sphingobium sp. LMA1-1-1.1]|uniref:hypothetical protein n=1 Tax=Sphingobium sp. LMA1-1-1.1 TaxID=3135238 RepID=UPI00343C476D
MGIHSTFSPATRAAIEAEIERLIELLNFADGDSDLEDGTDSEDDFTFTPYALGYGERRGPGCEVSDPGGGNVEDEGEAIDECELVDYYQARPAYGTDQSRGAINGDLIARRAELVDQYQDHLRCGSSQFARQIKLRIQRMDAVAEETLIARGIALP